MIVDEIDWTSAWVKSIHFRLYQGKRNKYLLEMISRYDDFKKEFNFNDDDTV